MTSCAQAKSKTSLHPVHLDGEDRGDFGRLCRQLGKIMDFDAVVLLQRNQKRDTLRTRQVYPPDPLPDNGVVVAVDGAVREMMEGSLSGAVCLDTTRSCCSLERQMARLGLYSTLCVPVQLGRGDGVICIGSHRPRAFARSAPSAMTKLQTQ